MRVLDLNARQWYMTEAVSQQWDYRTLKRNIDTQYYYRLMHTPDAKKPTVVDEMLQLTADYQMYAAKYLTYMPTKEELRREIERQKELFMLQQNNPDD